MPTTKYDAIVVGLGAMGSATLDALARRGVKVLGIDARRPPHAFGSSHGHLRMIRKAYFEHPDYVPLLERAYELWEELEEGAAQDLFVKNGLLITGKPETETIVGLETCYAEHRLPHERLSASDASGRFPMFSVPEDHVAFYDPSGGYIRIEDSIGEWLRRAGDAGADVRFDEEVLEWASEPENVTVKTAGGTYVTGALIVSPGPWAASLLEGLGVNLSLERRVQLWYDAGDFPHSPGSGFPCFASEMDYGFFYGFPPVDGEGLKTAEHSGDDLAATPEQLDREPRDGDETKVLRFLGTVVPELKPKLLRHAVCLYTMTPDGDFVIDRHPGCERVFVAAGLSGHGFKFVPVLGQALADLALEGSTEQPINFLGLRRFEKSGGG